MTRRLRLFLGVLACLVAFPVVAHADPVSAYIVTTVLGFSGTAAAVATFVVNAVLYSAGSFSEDRAFEPEDDQ
ncbi:hypothetical protein MU852_07905 [Brevundimonas albigilva]|uniref:hypothetical protein n=1 Tax=Brevundimonas albigilva TaxID=1312364 RepID=UPI00201B512E|nr:hypothetical protein [Brevundimonas albigilva]UQV19644.1 hypothetical protein MU852_07905 [Brevundimonas albigilva]